VTPPALSPDLRAALVAWLRAEARAASPLVRAVLATLALRLEVDDSPPLRDGRRRG